MSFEGAACSCLLVLNLEFIGEVPAQHPRPPCAKGAPRSGGGLTRKSLFSIPPPLRGTSLYTREAFRLRKLESPINSNLPNDCHLHYVRGGLRCAYGGGNGVHSHHFLYDDRSDRQLRDHIQAKTPACYRSVFCILLVIAFSRNRFRLESGWV